MRFVFAILLALMPSALVAQTPRAGVVGPLVDPTWVADHRGRIVILDVRDEPASFSKEGHIAGAVLINWREVRTSRPEDGVELQDMIPSAEVFTELMRKSGVNDGASIVITSRGREPAEMFLATRLFWQLRYFGHEAVTILDGGTGAWAAEGRPLSKAAPGRPKRGTWTAKTERRELLATTADVAEAVETRRPALTDSRRIENYLGTELYKERVARAGHIPTAKFADALLFVEPVRPVRFRPVAELRQIAEGLGIKPLEPMITYCDTGDWGSGTWFVFHELLGNKAARLYDGSMHAWTRSQSRPVTKFKME